MEGEIYRFKDDTSAQIRTMCRQIQGAPTLTDAERIARYWIERMKKRKYDDDENEQFGNSHYAD